MTLISENGYLNLAGAINICCKSSIEAWKTTLAESQEIKAKKDALYNYSIVG